MPHLKYNSTRPAAFVVARKTPEGPEIGYCADNIHGLIYESKPYIGFNCSGQHVQFPAGEVVEIRVTREGAGHCNACDRQYDATVVDD